MEDSDEDDAEFSKVKEFELRLKRRRRTTSSDNAAVSFEDSAQIESSGSEEGLERTGKHSSEPGVCFSKELDPIDQSSLKRQRGGGAGEEALAEVGVGDAPAKISDKENSSIGTGHRPGSASSPVTQSCPICGNRFSTSLLGPHVNRCLDSTSVGKNYAIFRRKLRVALPLASNQAPRSSPSEREAEQDKPEDVTATAAVSLLEFLTSLNIAEEVTKLKSHGYADLDSLRLATNDDLIKAGIEGVGRRKRILVELGAMFSERRQLGVSDSTLIPAKTGNLKALKGTNDVTLFPIFNKEQRQEPSSKPVQRQQREHPFYKKVGGTTFTVDSFRSKPGACRQFFLSHFHSDHYTGLSKSFKAGVIFCTEITAKLVQLRLGVPKDRIQILTLNEEMFVPDLGIGSPRGKDNGAFVTAVDANHCPGAAMFLFRVQSTGKTILHSGDCRYDKDLHTRNAALVRLVGGEGPRLDVMHLDTTYCDPKYSFPHQRIIIEAVLSLVKRESFNSRTLFLFGTYQLGKEKVWKTR
uniref:SAM domain-containing protein n=1 Tax=Rhodosorus marinus TaxID=101924 RepID=A0A7S3EL14_9RHOD|mmetsp:Transcript_42178/g.164840  ORF Transcript_42178/g.164840 Transcript_42178/m.164840 type:complete len:524 (+) Transcript_42178:35-1606(+)